MDNGCSERGIFLLYRQLANESDRGALIVSAALLDDALLNMLKAKFCPSLEREDELFEGIYAPLGTFAAKIDLAYRVGLFNAEFRKVLHLMRKLRNDFAHSVHKVDFSDPTVQSRLRELSDSTKKLFLPCGKNCQRSRSLRSKMQWKKLRPIAQWKICSHWQVNEKYLIYFSDQLGGSSLANVVILNQ